jgi:hypothetical protein
MGAPLAEARFAVTVRFLASWICVGRDYQGLDHAAREAAQAAVRLDVDGVSIWRHRGESDVQRVPWPVVQDVAATLALDGLGELEAKYAAGLSDPDSLSRSGLRDLPARSEHDVEAYFKYDGIAPTPSRSTVTFFEYDAPPARRRAE